MKVNEKCESLTRLNKILEMVDGLSLGALWKIQDVVNKEVELIEIKLRDSILTCIGNTKEKEGVENDKSILHIL